MDEGHFDHSQEVGRAFLEPRENAAAFLEPADQAFDDVSLSILSAIEWHTASISVFIRFAGNHRADAALGEILVDPVSPISFVAGQGDWMQSGIRLLARDLAGLKQFGQAGGFMRLSRREMGMQRMPVRITQDVDFRAKPAARTA